MAHIKKKVPWYAGIVNISVVTLGNLVGSLIIAGLIGKCSGVFSANPYHACKFRATQDKCSMTDFLYINRCDIFRYH